MSHDEGNMTMTDVTRDKRIEKLSLAVAPIFQFYKTRYLLKSQEFRLGFFVDAACTLLFITS